MKTPLARNLADRLRSASLRDELPIFVYGAGLYASEIESFLEHEGIAVEGFFVGDAYAAGPHRVRGSVLPASEARRLHPDFHTIIGVCRDPRAIDAELAADGVGGAGQRFAIDCRFWREFSELNEAYLESRSAELQAVRDLFSDELSRDTFDEIIATKLTRDPAGLASIVRYQQYFPKDLPAFAACAEDIVVDAGAFTGDTLAAFLQLVPRARCRAYHAFEADPDNASKLTQYVDENGLDFVHCHTVALGDKVGSIRFDAGGTTSSKMTSSGGVEVPLATLDSFALKPSLIKMDIEGAEAMALRGAAATIATNRPRLAITTYHSLEDFLGIPRLVKELCPEYRLHLRIHRPYTEEFVLYAAA
jgi:FkbM family methyltransferase